MLCDYKVDIAFVSRFALNQFGPLSEWFTVKPFENREVMLVAPMNSPAIKSVRQYEKRPNERIKQAMLRNITELDLILPSTGSSFRQFLDNFFEDNDIKMEHVHEVNRGRLILKMVRQKMGVTLQQKWLLDAAISEDPNNTLEEWGLEAISMKCIPLWEVLVMFDKTYLSQAAKQFLKELMIDDTSNN